MEKKGFNIFMVLFAVLILICITGVAYADEVTDSINEALTQYKNNDYSGASGSLTYALQLIGQKKGGQLQQLFPDALPGWTAEEATSNAAGAAVFGGGVDAERQYRREPAEGSDEETGYITIKYITDSPMMQGMIMMMSNPMFAASDGGKLEKIKGEKAIVKFSAEGKNGDINIVVANKTLVTVEGNGITKEDLKAYTEAIDYKKIAALQ